MSGLLQLADLTRGPGEALLRATMTLGFSEPVARAGLAAEFAAWTAPGALDGLLAKVANDRARSPKAVLVIGASTLPASLLRQVFLSRSLGARVYVKTASGQEALAEAMAAVDPEIVPTPFPSGDTLRLRAAIDAVDTVVALGSDETVAEIDGLMPFHKTFVGHGHKVSAAWVEHPDEAAAEGLAEDLCAWDQAGCLSPQAAWVAGDRHAFAERLVAALGRREATLPMTLPASAARARRVALTLGRMTGEVYETATTALVSLEQGGFRPSPGYRLLWLLPPDEEALRALAPRVGLIGTDTSSPLVPGARTTALGAMQRPALGEGDGGLGALLTAS